VKRQPVMNAINRCMFRSCVHVPTRDVPPDLIREIVNEHVLLLMAARNGFVLMMRSKNGLLLLIMAARVDDEVQKWIIASHYGCSGTPGS
jgi:hypothetical protein